MTDETRTLDDLAAVVEEIRAEARHKRESGEYPATLERELDALFEDLVPERLNEHDFEAVLDRAERASLIDLHAPIEDRRRVYSQVKRGVQKLILWYMEYVVRQLATFAASTTRAVRLLGQRVERLEERHEELARRLPDVGDDLDLLARDLDASESWSATIVELFQQTPGRVLHAEAGDGGLVKALGEAGVNAYGVDPLAARGDGGVGEKGPSGPSERGSSRGTLDLRTQPALDHLMVVGTGSLAGLVLSGVVDRATTAARIALAERAADVLAPEGMVVVVGTAPEAWSRAVPAPLADLAPGRPFHPATWQLLLERHGFTDVEVRGPEQPDGADGTSYLVTARRAD